jgi:hypothetical protein
VPHTANTVQLADRIGAATADFRPIGLADIGAASLMDRIDTKFLLPAAEVPLVLAGLGGDYRVLEIGGRRLAGYSTRYFDTPSLDMYRAHRAGRAPRWKVRLRAYVDTGDEFLEVKRKSNHLRTTKARMAVRAASPDPACLLRAQPLLGVANVFDLATLAQSVTVEFQRLTLVAADAAERITLDIGLSVSRGDHTLYFPNAVVGEVKQYRRGASAFLAALRARRLRAGSVSKYCLGIALLVPGAGSNRFRPALRRLERIGAGVPNEQSPHLELR